jgi:hypothetical protein
MGFASLYPSYAPIHMDNQVKPGGDELFANLFRDF